MLLGDSVCALNPVFGQGMTVVCLAARMLGEAVARARSSPGGCTRGWRGYQRGGFGGLVGLCWNLTTTLTLDLAHPETRGRRPPPA